MIRLGNFDVKLIILGAQEWAKYTTECCFQMMIGEALLSWFLCQDVWQHHRFACCLSAFGRIFPFHGRETFPSKNPLPKRWICQKKKWVFQGFSLWLRCPFWLISDINKFPTGKCPTFPQDGPRMAISQRPPLPVFSKENPISGLPYPSLATNCSGLTSRTAHRNTASCPTSMQICMPYMSMY